MNNSRRFVRPSAPTTPRSASRVLPTPPTSATTTFHVPEDNLPNIRPKLPIDGFAQSKRARPGIGSHATHSPARPSRVPKPPTVDADHHPRPQRIFGQSNGLLPSLSPPPALPSLLTRPAPQSVSARFSSPFSPPDNQDTTGNHHAEQEEDELDTPGPHTSISGPPGDPVVYERTLQTHSSAYQAEARRQNTPIEFQGEFDNSGAESPCPSKRRATGDHGYQVPTKRKRSTLNIDQNLDDDRYLSQEPLSTVTAPQLSQSSLPHGYYSTSLEAYIEAHQSEWIAAQKRWQTCTMEEWQSGPKELTAELEKMMDMASRFVVVEDGVKAFMTQVAFYCSHALKRMEVYAGINEDVQAHKTRLDSRDAQLAKEKGRLIKQAGGLAGGFIPG